MSRDHGSVTVEMVLLAPVLVVMMLFIVFLGRATGAVEQVRHAADQGARAASLVAPARMQDVAEQAVGSDLATNGVNCSSVDVAVSIENIGASSSVTVTVGCAVSVQGLALLGANARRVSAGSTEIIDTFRGG